MALSARQFENCLWKLLRSRAPVTTSLNTARALERVQAVMVAADRRAAMRGFARALRQIAVHLVVQGDD